MIQRSLAVAIVVASTACASPASTGAGSAPSPAVQGVLERAATTQPPAPAPAPAKSAAPAPAAEPKEMSPLGTYLLNLTAQGNQISVTLLIARRQDGTIGGSITSDVLPEALPVNSVEVSGKTMKVYVTGPNSASVVLNMILDGDIVSGDWSMGGDGSAISGKKLP